MNGFYKLGPKGKDALYALFELAHDIEVTLFGEDGRDITFKGKEGDVLVLTEIGGRYSLSDVIDQEDADDLFVPAGV